MKRVGGFIFTIVVFLGFFAIHFSASAQETVDLECLKRQLFDPSVVCTSLPSGESVRVVEDSFCEAMGGIRTKLTERCIDYFDGVDHIVRFVVVEDAAKCSCANSERCIMVNALSGGIFPVGFGPVAPFDITTAAEWSCVSALEPGNINILGADLGPLTQVIPKFLRTGFSVLLGFFGFYSLWNIFWAIWDSTTGRSQEKYENAQKTVLDAFMGLFYVIIALVVVQLISSLFGISGNIFEFSYEPPGVYPVSP